MAAFVIPSIFTAVDKVSAPVRRMSRNVQKFSVRAERGLARAERGFRRLLSPLAKARKLLGGFGLFIGGAAIVAAMGGMIGVFADFEQANASLSSVMATATRPQLIALQSDAKSLGAITAKTATEVVGLQEAFARLGFTAPQIVNMTEATIAGSIAMRGELSDTAGIVGAMVKTFDDFSSIDTPEIIDKMTLATQRSALNFEKLQTGLPIVAGAANAAGVGFTTLLALMGKLSDAGIDVSSSSTALRNIFIESAKQGLSFSQILDKIEKSQDKLTSANDEFGKRAAVPAAILSKSIRETEKLDKVLQSAAKGQALAGTAAIAAAKELNTLRGDTILLNSAWEGWILSVEDGTGELSKNLRVITQVATEVLALASGSAKASGELSTMENQIRVLAEKSIFWLKVIRNTVISLVAFKVILIASRIILSGYSIALGIAAVAQGRMALSLRTNTLALSTYTVVARVATVAARAWGIAMFVATGPIGLIILAIIALIALTVVIVKQWNSWGAALTLFMGPLGFVISLIQSFRRNWEAIQQVFKTEGILAGFKRIGATILDAILMPLQQVFKLLSNIPGVGGFATDVVSKIASLREGLGVNVTTDESGNVLPVNVQSAAAEAQRTDRFESSETANVNINIADETGRADVVTEGAVKRVTVTPTFGPGGGFKF